MKFTKHPSLAKWYSILLLVSRLGYLVKSKVLEFCTVVDSNNVENPQ